MPWTSRIAISVALIGLAGFGAYRYVTAPTKPATDQSEATVKPKAMVADGNFHLMGDQTTASFTLNEILRGSPKTVIGTTHDVTGAFMADRMHLADVSWGEIKINARTFVTDSEQRNNAIRRMILKTEDDANEYIVFTPKTMTGLPETAEVGQPLSFSVNGDLTVSGVTKTATFAVTASFTSEDELIGSAETNLHYPDFGVSVPNLPFLANVDQDVTLKLDFVAKR